MSRSPFTTENKEGEGEMDSPGGRREVVEGANVLNASRGAACYISYHKESSVSVSSLFLIKS